MKIAATTRRPPNAATLTAIVPEPECVLAEGLDDALPAAGVVPAAAVLGELAAVVAAFAVVARVLAELVAGEVAEVTGVLGVLGLLTEATVEKADNKEAGILPVY
jgi:hypothetical protein